MKKVFFLIVLVLKAHITYSQLLTVCSGSCINISSTPPSTNSVLYVSPTTSIAPNSSGIFVVCPNFTSIYTLQASPTSSAQSVWTVLVYPSPMISISASQNTVCQGQSSTLHASGAATYSWSNSQTTSTIAVSPIIPTTYSVIGVDANGCIGTSSISILVNTISITAPPITICTGQAGTLIAYGGTSYNWWIGGTTNSIVVSPSVTTNYTVVGSTAQGCYQVINTQIVVSNSPSLTSYTTSICPGNSATLLANGVNTYTWSNGSNASSIIVSPSTNTVYTISGGLTGCPGTASATASVIISPNPTITIATTKTTICIGESGTLTASGATTYSWSSAASTSSLVISPTIATNYFVSGTSSVGCSGSASIMISVAALPNLSTSATPSVCVGQTNTITVSGASSFTINHPAVVASSSLALFVVTSTSPSTLTFTITGFNSEGCSATTQVTQYISACLGITSLEKEWNLNIFPNPANEIITIGLSVSERFKLQVIDIKGVVVLEDLIDSNKQSISIRDLKAGIYFVFIQSDSGYITKKLIVEN